VWQKIAALQLRPQYGKYKLNKYLHKSNLHHTNYTCLLMIQKSITTITLVGICNKNPMNLYSPILKLTFYPKKLSYFAQWHIRIHSRPGGCTDTLWQMYALWAINANIFFCPIWQTTQEIILSTFCTRICVSDACLWIKVWVIAKRGIKTMASVGVYQKVRWASSD